MEQKRCPKCCTVKSVDSFSKNKAAKSGYNSWCKPCMAKMCQDIRRANPDKAKQERRDWIKKNPRKLKNRNLKYDYNITLDQYEAMLKDQDSKCKICQKACSSGKSMSVDHCHLTLKVRGLLCAKCNKALGLFNDNPTLLQRASEYLKC